MKESKYIYEEFGVTNTSTESIITYPLVNGKVYETKVEGYSFDCPVEKKLTLFREDKLNKILSCISLEEFKSILDEIPLYPVLTTTITSGFVLGSKEPSNKDIQKEASLFHKIPYKKIKTSTYDFVKQKATYKYSHEFFTLSDLVLGHEIIPRIFKLKGISTNKELISIYDLDSIFIKTPVLNKNNRQLSIQVNMLDLLNRKVENFKNNVKKEVSSPVSSINSFYAPFTLNNKEIPFSKVIQTLEEQFKLSLEKVLN